MRGGGLESKHRTSHNCQSAFFLQQNRAGQAGSRHYVSQLSDEEARKIAFYFNFDQMATPHPNYTVHANNDADLYGATVLFEQLQEQGVVPQVSYVLHLEN